MPNQLYPPVRAAKMTRHWHSLPSYLEPPGKPPGGSFSFARASLNSLTASIVSSNFLCAASFTSARSRLSDRLSLLSLIVLAASRTFCSRLSALHRIGDDH